MQNILFFIAGIALGYCLGSGKKGNDAKTENVVSNDAKNIREVKAERKEEILKILAEKGRVDNNDIQKALGIADSTATNYLDELEKEGKIKQVGKTGKGVYYELAALKNQ